ncbi:MAG: YbbR-like domain-containing protein [Hominenteromicrobium sp.]
MRKKKAQSGGQEEKKLHPLRVFENNTLLLILSFLCAAVIWFAMMAGSAEGRAAVVSNVPIKVEVSEAAQEAGIRVFSMNYTSTDVSVTGSSLITSKVTADDLSVTATLDPATSMLTGNSMQQATLTLRANKKGNTLAEYEVESVSPSEVTVVYDKYKETQLTIESNIQYTAAENYYAAATPTLSTDIVTISGPESSVNKVARAVLVYTFSDELTQSKLISCKIALLDVNGDVIDPSSQYITLSDDTVDVSIAVTSRQTVTLEADIRNIPESFAKNRITIDPETIEIAGDSETISKYKTLTLATPINFLDVTPDNNTFTVAIPVPNGVTNISRVETATVSFNLNGYGEAQFTTNNISVINVPEGKEAELSTKTMTVKVIGTEAQLSRLTGESIFCTVDLSSVSDPSGSIEVPVTISINNADSCWATGVYTAHVTVTDKAASGASD